jgi:MFS transporter, Spinster family, sphingosine-1-phosphate transporter
MESSPASSRTARTALALLLSINLFNYIDRYVLAAVLKPIGAEFFPGHENDSLTLGKLGLLTTAFLVSYMLTVPVLGWLADRMSRWILIGLSVLIWSIATGGSGLAGTFTALLLMRCFVGIGEAGYGPSAPTIISDLFPVARRGAVLAWFYMAIPVGSALGYVVGSLISPHFGWRAAFLVVTPPGIILAACSFLMKDPRAQRDHDQPIRDSRWSEYLALAKTPSYVLDTLGMTAMTFALGGIAAWMPKYLSESPGHGGRGLPPWTSAVFGGITAAAGLLATLLGGLAGDKLRPRLPGSYFIVSAVGMFIACPFIVAMLYLPFPWAWAPMSAAIFFLFFNTGPTNAILANVTPPAVRATAFAANIFILHLFGDAAAPPILGSLAGRFGWNAAFLVVAAAIALSGVFWLCGAPHLQADMKRVESAAA